MMNLTHSKIDKLKLDKTEWKRVMIAAHTSALESDLPPWWMNPIISVGGGFTVFAVAGLLTLTLTCIAKYRKNMRATAAGLAQVI